MANFIPKITYTELGSGTAKVITFTTPPEGDPFGEVIDADAKTTETSNGNFQTQWNKNDELFKISFRLETLAIKTLLDTFFKVHVLKGGVFNYFKHSDEADYETYRMVSTQFKPIRAMADSSNNDFLYNISWTQKRTLDLEYESEGLGVGAINWTQFDITDGANDANVDGLSVDDSVVGAMFVKFYIYRKTTGGSGVRKSSAGTLLISRNNDTDDWEISQDSNGYAGVSFDINNTGQVTYTADTLAGVPSENYIYFQADVSPQGS